MKIYTSSLLDSLSVPHAFYTRQGGVSSAPYKNLNVFINGDDKDNALKNRALIQRHYKQSIVYMNQKHGINVEHIGHIQQTPLSCDGLVTKNRHLMLGVQTADCAPVLIYVDNIQTIAALHCGWRGLVQGIIEKSWEKLVHKGAEKNHTYIAIGPCISKKNFEVGEDVYASIIEKQFFTKGEEDKYFFDLSGFIAYKFMRLGILSVDPLDLDTYSNKEDFFSCRRSFHEGAHDFGRQLSLIGLKEEN